MTEEKEYTAYFDACLPIKAESIEKAWEKWEIVQSKIKDLGINDIELFDIY